MAYPKFTFILLKNCYDLYKSGLFTTMLFKNSSYDWETFVETEEGLIELKSRVEESDPAINYTDMVELFRTGNIYFYSLN